ncbi:tRNA lysidine(34) synthetase TilS [Spiroplasma clarkii]|uniref:tRNA(Ile)-lysidine synthase n=1 Tax=Spiroplasma clarkii TaxID=2139 RepID=A0A2K8KJ82_9MOLU|nr:tRNA lysidine(34) synthetase TilS [Spiroplasma clarkii]ATX70349.1 tRNA(Ile)-lysidine synthase [Spiroplasma clarkii]
MTKFSICNKKKYVVGFSGGPDSLFLLDNLVRKVNAKNIVACHVNYNYRVDAKNDQQICENYCQEKKIKLYIKVIEQDYSKLKSNFESWARQVRYNFFKEILAETGFDKVLIAHNLNDDIETYLMQKNKNSLVDYFGIKKQSLVNEMQIYRPIIGFKKSEILDYLQQNNLVYAVDSTNTDIKFKRNAIRKNLKEADFDELLVKKAIDNKRIKNLVKKTNNLEPQNFYSIDNFSGDKEQAQRFLFKIIQNLNLETNFYSRKKQTLKEIINQLNSDKSYIKILIGELLIIKDRQNVHFLNKNMVLVINKKICELTKQEKDFFNHIDLTSYNSNLYVSNDWEHLKNSLTYENKKLSKLYKKAKTSYFERFFKPIVFDKTNKIILNNLF